MPPKRQKKLHELADIVERGSIITDTRKQRFIVGEEFARGGFGRIYSGYQEESKEYSKPDSLVIKMEPQTNGPLFTEITVFQRILMPDSLHEWMQRYELHHLGLPPFISSGIFRYKDKSLRFLILPKYWKPLEEIIAKSGGTLKSNIAFTIAKQCADSLFYMQDQNYVHADIKADNILLASPNSSSKIYLIDFGLAKMVKDVKEKPDTKKAHNGTLLFTSLDAHRGCSPSFRGDLEILLYNVLFWIVGSLPWIKKISDPNKVFDEKLSFRSNLQVVISKLVAGPIATSLINLFKIAYEAEYSSKIDYHCVNSIFDKLVKETHDSETIVHKKPTKRKRQPMGVENKKIQLACSSTPYEENSNSVSGLSDPVPKSLRLRKFNSKNSEMVDNTKDIRRSSRLSAIGTSTLLETGLRKEISSIEQNRKLNDESSSFLSSPPASPPKKKKFESKAFIEDKKKEKKVSVKKVKVTNSSSRQPICKSQTSTEPSDEIKSEEATLNPLSDREVIEQIIPGVRNMKAVRRSLESRLVKKFTKSKN